VKTVDVIVPCYNYGRFLRDCVKSVLVQPDVEVRVLIIDDCSPDETAIVGPALAAEDSRVSYRRHQVNRGHIATYNEGLIEWAVADYSMLLSADDLVTPGAITRAAEIMERYPDVHLVYGRWFTVNPNDPTPTFEGLPKATAKIIPGRRLLADACAMAHNPIACSAAVCVRTATQRKIGGYLAALPHTGDLEMWLRFAAAGNIAVVDTYQGIYRKHSENMSWGYSGRPLRDLSQRLAAFQAFFENYRHDIVGGIASLERSVIETLAIDAVWAAYAAFEQGKVDSFEECMQFAAAVNPNIRSTPAYRKLRLKRLVGCARWAKLRPIIRALLRSPYGSAA
jgi:glycosyltransferase involved in cell wall biosynthesis